MTEAPSEQELSYQRYIGELNEHTPTSEQAASHILRLGFPETSWDRILVEGVEKDTNHELRAVIAIARGDQRPLGEVYDEVRQTSSPVINEFNLRKTEGIARKFNPLRREQSGFF